MKIKTSNLAIPLTLALLAVIFAPGSVSGFQQATPEPELKKFSYVQLQMAMPMRITVWAASESNAEESCKLAFAKAAELVNVFSDYDDKSEAMLLTRSKTDEATPISDHLMTVLNFSKDLHQKSNGAFDVTSGPIVKLWRKARKQEALPNAEELKQARGRVGIDRIRLHPKTDSATMLAEDIEVDFGGIAKGYIGDQVIDLLRENGIAISYYEAGGDIVLGDAPPNTNGWTIVVGNKKDGTARTIELKRCAISTSGDAQQFVEISGIRYSHVIDPRTGMGITTSRTAFVIAPSGMQSDALATTGCVMNESAFQDLLDQYENTTGWSKLSQSKLKTQKFINNVSR